MIDESQTSNLDDPANVRCHRREWVAERIGWIVVGGILLATCFGVLGPGWLSKRTRQTSDGELAVEYYAVERYEAPATLQCRIRRRSDEPARLSLAISRSFTDEVTIEALTPRPETVEMHGDRTVYSFQAAMLHDDGLITWRYKYNTAGRIDFDIGLVDGSELAISQLVLP